MCVTGGPRYKHTKVSHSLSVGAVGLESHCILGTTNERRSPSLILKRYCWVDRDSFPVVVWRSKASSTRPSGNFLHHNRAALTTRLRRLSRYSLLVKNIVGKHFIIFNTFYLLLSQTADIYRIFSASGKFTLEYQYM